MGERVCKVKKDVPENLPLSLSSCPSCSSSACFLRVYHGRFPQMRPRDTESFGGVRPRDNSGRVADVPERHHQHRGRSRLRTLLLWSIPSTLPVTMIKHTMEEKCVLNYSSTVVLIKYTPLAVKK